MVTRSTANAERTGSLCRFITPTRRAEVDLPREVLGFGDIEPLLLGLVGLALGY